MAPRSVRPLAETGVRYVHDARPALALGTPRTFALPILPVHRTPLGRAGEPFDVTRTEAVTTDPALAVVGFPDPATACTTTSSSSGSAAPGSAAASTAAAVRTSRKRRRMAARMCQLVLFESSGVRAWMLRLSA